MPSPDAAPDTPLPAAFRRRCEHIATLERYKLALQAFSPLPARVLAAAYGAVILTPEQTPAGNAEAVQFVLQQPGWSAVLLSKAPVTIIHNPTHSPARQEANLMHEFAHYFLRHPFAKLTAATGLASSREHELEATYLGGCLQIPQRGLAWASQLGWNQEQVAVHFGASPEMVRWRINSTGIALPTAV